MTIKDVAKYSGVSITTISRVLNNHPDVREEMRAKVLKAIKSCTMSQTAAQGTWAKCKPILSALWCAVLETLF